jgi:hypothetical protein
MSPVHQNQPLAPGHAALDRLQADPTFTALADELRAFNVFEAIGVERQELRHSSYLASVLDPGGKHRLGDAFLRRFLERVLGLEANRGRSPAIRIDELNAWPMRGLTVHREWQRFDVLILDVSSRIVVLIENKIDSPEHGSQLDDYLRRIRSRYPTPPWRVLPIYLTPRGQAPSRAEYLISDYETVAAVAEEVAADPPVGVDPVARESMVHYARMLRRRIVPDPSLIARCRSIYHAHRDALDLIFQHGPNLQQQVQKHLIELVGAESTLVADDIGRIGDRLMIRFTHPDLDGLPPCPAGAWTNSGRMLLFQFDNRPDRLDLGLWVGPGPDETRRALLDFASARSDLFELGEPEYGKNGWPWQTIKSWSFLSPDAFSPGATGGIEAEIDRRWSQFLSKDLTDIVAAISRSVRDQLVAPTTR